MSQEAFAAHVGLGYKQWGNFESAAGRIGLDARPEPIARNESAFGLDLSRRGSLASCGIARQD